MAWWDGDEIDYDSDWYQGNENDDLIPDSGSTDTSYNDYGGNADYGSGQTTDNVITPEAPAPDYGNQDYFGGINTGGGNTSYNPNTGVSMGSIQSTLSNIFSGNMNNIGTMGKGLAAVMEGIQNKKKASAMQQIANNPALDPFGSQRGFYQQQAQQAVTNPYDSPIVKAQVAQMQNAQNIKDAAAGRRSNQLTSSPALMAEMAKVAQQYQQQMAQQGGSNIAPNGAAISSALTSGAQADVNGYTSPLLAALGMGTQSSANANTRQSAFDKFMAG